MKRGRWNDKRRGSGVRCRETNGKGSRRLRGIRDRKKRDTGIKMNTFSLRDGLIYV